MLKRVLSVLLMAVCGAGLLVAWRSTDTAWFCFELAIYGLALVWFVGWGAGQVRGAAWSWLVLPFLGLVACGALQLYLHWTAYRFDTLLDTLRWGTYAAVFFLAVQSPDNRGDGRRFCWIVTVYGCLLAGISVLQYFLFNGRIFWLFSPGQPASGLGPFLNRDHFASFAILVLPLAAAEVARSRNRWFFLIATVLLYAAVVASASRAGFALATVELILLFMVLGLSGRIVAATVALAVLSVFVVGWQNLYSRLNTGDRLVRRLEFAKGSIEMVEANPWKGSGLGTWTLMYPAHAKTDFGAFVNAAHNDWLQWAADGGLVFAGFLLILFGGSVVLVRRVPWVMGVPMVFLHSAIDFPMQGHFLPAAVFLVFGYAVGVARERQASPPARSVVKHATRAASVRRSSARTSSAQPLGAEIE